MTKVFKKKPERLTGVSLASVSVLFGVIFMPPVTDMPAKKMMAAIRIEKAVCFFMDIPAFCTKMVVSIVAKAGREVKPEETARFGSLPCCYEWEKDEWRKIKTE